jgi:hypothetical protein
MCRRLPDFALITMTVVPREREMHIAQLGCIMVEDGASSRVCSL